MDVASLLTEERIAWNVSVSSKKRALEYVARRLTKGASYLSEQAIFTALVERERLGSTAIGNGVAIPHGRIKGCTDTIAAFIKLSAPIDFDAVDRKPVDMIFAMIVPESCTNEHLNTLAQLAEMFSDEMFSNQLRNAESSRSVSTLISSWQSRHTHA